MAARGHHQLLMGDGGVASIDPFWANVVSLLHFEDADGSGAITDVTGKTWVNGGSGLISYAQQKFGAGSLVTGGGATAHQTCTDAAFTIGTNQFTMEGWFRRLGNAAISMIYDQRASLTNGLYPALYHDASGNLHYFVNNADQIVGTGGNLPLSTWVHVAIARDASNNTRLFVNGTQTGSTYSDSNNYVFGRMRIGASSYNSTGTSSNCNGHHDEFRFTMACRYASNFTPPSAAFPNS